MIAYRIEDLIVWQLANQLKREIYAFTARPPASRDFKYRDQIRDAAALVTRNTAEGFGLFRPKQFKNFLAIAAGSLQEVKDQLHRRLQAYLATCKSHQDWRGTPPRRESQSGSRKAPRESPDREP